MFSNLLYFLVALIIYATSELFPGQTLPEKYNFFNPLMATIVFALICNMVFRRLEKKISSITAHELDLRVNRYIARLSMLALIVFAVDIYGFKFRMALAGIRLFTLFPTFEAVVFLAFFLIHLSIVWNAAYRLQKNYFSAGVSKKDYMISNISFSMPALLPWFCLSFAADLLALLPWQPLRDALQSPAGQIGYIIVFLVVISIFGPVLIKNMWKCERLGPGPARTRIENLCRTAGLAYADILQWNLFGGSMITAGVMGLIGRLRYILVTPALLNTLNDEELDAVLMHEIGHVQRYHMIFYLVFFIGFIGLNFVFFEPVMLLFYVMEPVYRVFAYVGIDRATALAVLITIFMITVFIVYFRFVFGFFMRNFERQADLHVYRFSRDASWLVSTFYKIASFSGQSMDTPNWHHFSIGQRIRFLEKCRINPSLINAHHSRVRKMVVWYCIISFCLIGAGYAIQYGPVKKKFENFIAERILSQQLGLDPANSDMYALVGDYYYNKNQYEKAIDAYENVLRIDKKNVHALNNLAWLFATCPDKRFRNPKKALVYAEKALKQSGKAQAFVLDTYAQALFANHDFKGAVAAAKKAVDIAGNKKEYYEKQLKNFKNALID